MLTYSSIAFSPVQYGFFANPALRTDNLPNEDDGVQIIMSSIISDAVPDNLLQKILTTLCYISKARNDKRFGNKAWTPSQVHHAVTTNISVADWINYTG